MLRFVHLISYNLIDRLKYIKCISHGFTSGFIWLEQCGIVHKWFTRPLVLQWHAYYYTLTQWMLNKMTNFYFFNFQIFSNAFSWLKFLTSDTWWPFEMLNHRLAIYILMNELTLDPMIVGLDVVPGKTYMLAFTAFALQWNPLKRPGMSH